MCIATDKILDVDDIFFVDVSIVLICYTLPIYTIYVYILYLLYFLYFLTPRPPYGIITLPIFACQEICKDAFLILS